MECSRGSWCQSCAMPGMGCLSRPSPELCPMQLPLSALISSCLLAALNMSPAQGDRKEPLLPRDGVVVKLHALGPPSHSLPLPSGHPKTPSRHKPEDGKACGHPLSPKRAPLDCSAPLWDAESRQPPQSFVPSVACAVSNPPGLTHTRRGGGAVVMGGNIS